LEPLTSKRVIISGNAIYPAEANGGLARFLSTLLFLTLCGLIAFAPLAFGAVEVWAVCTVEVTSALLLGFWAASLLTTPTRFIRLNPLFVPVSALGTLVALQLLFSRTAYWYASWFNALLWTSYAVVLFVSAQVFQTERRIIRFGLFLAAYAFGLSFFSVWQQFTSGGKIYWVFAQASPFYGPYINHAHYACLMEMLWPIPFFLGITRAFPFSIRILLLLSAVVTAASIFLSHSFGGMIAFVAQVIFLSFLIIGWRHSHSVLRYLLLLLFVLCLWLALIEPAALLARLSSFSTFAGNAEWQDRWFILRDSMHMTREHPFLGWGLGAFSFVYPAYRSFYTNSFVNAAHNDYLQIWVELGLIGFALSLWFMVVLYRRGLRNAVSRLNDPGAAMPLAALIGCTGFLVHALSNFNLQIPANGIMFFSLAAIATSPLNELGLSPARYRKSEEKPAFLVRRDMEKFATGVSLACVILAAALGWSATRLYKARAVSRKLNERSLQRAIAMEPKDAEPYSLLCRYRMAVLLDSGVALQACKRATELNAYDATYWMDLAQAYLDVGMLKEQGDAVRRALSIDPKTPNNVWNAANFFLAQNDVHDALTQFAVILNTDPSLSQRVLGLWQRVGGVQAMMSIFPADPIVYLDFIKLLLSQQQPQPAGQVWARLIQLDRKFDFREAVFYVESLLQAGDVDAAREAWQQIGKRASGFEPYLPSENLVVNSSFESDILNTGFDWRYTAVPGIVVQFDTTQFSDGKRSLLVSFAGAKTGADAGLYQLVPVRPDTEYLISAFVKSDKLTSANEPRLRVVDAGDGTVLAISQEIGGTTSWQRLDSVFRTGPRTKLLSLRISRDQTSTLVAGRMWIDSVQLVETGKSASSSSPR
jgi:O-antigen ligase